MLLVAYEAQSGQKKCPPLLKEKIKKRLGLKEKKKRPEVKWLLGALVFFALSFVVSRYFMQFLVASAVLGVKWAMTGEGAKRAIMIFKGIKNDQASDSSPNYSHRNNLPKV